MQLSLPARVAAAIFAILALATALTGTLGFYKYRTFYAEVLRDRLALVLGDVGTTIETSLALGLPLDGLPTVNRILGDNLDRDPRILSIEFYDEAGTIHYSVDESLRGDLVTKEWLAQKTTAEERVWVRVEPDALVAGIDIDGPLGLKVGALALRYDRADFDSETRAMALRIAGICGGIVVVFAALGAFLTYRLTREPRDRLRGMRDSIAAGPGAAGVTEGETRGFLSAVQDADAAIEQANHELNALAERGHHGRNAPAGQV